MVKLAPFGIGSHDGQAVIVMAKSLLDTLKHRQVKPAPLGAFW
jgi:hypothetical protein